MTPQLVNVKKDFQDHIVNYSNARIIAQIKDHVTLMEDVNVCWAIQVLTVLKLRVKTIAMIGDDVWKISVFVSLNSKDQHVRMRFPKR